MNDLLLLMHAAATLSLFGLIWTIQLVHYPMFAGMARDQFVDWHESHAARISLIVVPLMVIEAVTAVLLCLSPPPGVPAALPWIGAGLVLVHLGSTAFLQVPLHRKLAEGLDPSVVRRLVNTNWLRTVVWTVRAGLVLMMVERSL
jgi:hypothetical protein